MKFIDAIIFILRFLFFDLFSYAFFFAFIFLLNFIFLELILYFLGVQQVSPEIFSRYIITLATIQLILILGYLYIKDKNKTKVNTKGIINFLVFIIMYFVMVFCFLKAWGNF